jgi:PAS domain S-box-containing protein
MNTDNAYKKPLIGGLHITYEDAFEILESISEPFYAVDTQWRFTYLNRMAEKVLGASREKLIGKNIWEEFPLGVGTLAYQHMHTAMDEQRSILFENYSKFLGRWVEAEIHPTHSGVCVYFHDIDKRKQIEASLRESESKYRRIVETAQEGIWIIDANSETTFVNQRLCEMLGYSEGEMLGTPLFAFMENDDVSNANNQVERRQQGITEHHEFKFRCKNGTPMWALVSTNPFTDDDGNYTGALAMIVDITQRKHQEHALQEMNSELERKVAERTAQLTHINKELEAFNYSVSHDLRQPLRALDGFSQAILEDYSDLLDEIGKHYLQRIRLASQRMGHIIDDLLNLSRLSRQELRHKPIDLSQLALECLVGLQDIQPQRSVVWHIQPDMVAMGDERLLQIAFNNLLQNAWKFTQIRQTATIEFGRMEKDGQSVYFVRDNGAGFDMTYASKLFGAFQRLHRAEEFEGTGIGLATVQRIIHRHGGQIWAESVLNEGATFYFTIPDSEM